MALPSMLVTDTNIWIDLENGKVLAAVFRLPYQFFAIDSAIEEYIHPGLSRLQELGLTLHGLEPESLLELVQLRQLHNQLSVIDLASLLLARAIGANLVTGDRRLNLLAKAQGITVHGVLWLVDEMVIYHVLTEIQAADALREMLNLGARLPVAECQKRIDLWSN